jgi:hypothetical protein
MVVRGANSPSSLLALRELATELATALAPNELATERASEPPRGCTEAVLVGKGGAGSDSPVVLTVCKQP